MSSVISSASRLRILYVVDHLAIGGLAMFLLRKIQRLRSRGHFAALAYRKKESGITDFHLQQYLQNENLFCLAPNFDSMTFRSIQPLINELKVNIVHAVAGHPDYLKRAKEMNPDLVSVSTLAKDILERDRTFNHRLYTD